MSNPVTVAQLMVALSNFAEMGMDIRNAEVYMRVHGSEGCKRVPVEAVDACFTRDEGSVALS